MPRQTGASAIEAEDGTYYVSGVDANMSNVEVGQPFEVYVTLAPVEGAYETIIKGDMVVELHESQYTSFGDGETIHTEQFHMGGGSKTIRIVAVIDIDGPHRICAAFINQETTDYNF